MLLVDSTPPLLNKNHYHEHNFIKPKTKICTNSNRKLRVMVNFCFKLLHWCTEVITWMLYFELKLKLFQSVLERSKKYSSFNFDSLPLQIYLMTSSSS